MLVDMICYGIILPIIPLVLEQEFKVSESLTGLLFASYSAGSLIATPIFGALTDRIGRKKPFLIGLLSLALSTILFAYGGKLPAPPVSDQTRYFHLAILFSARFAQGVSAAVTWVIGLALIADIYPPDQLGQMIGSVIGGNAIGSLLGPIIGGILYQHFGYRLPFFFAAVLACLDMVVRLVLVSDDAIEIHKQENLRLTQETRDKKLQDDKVAAPKVDGIELEEIGLVDGAEVEIIEETRFSKMAAKPAVVLICLSVMMSSGGFGSLEPVTPLFISSRFHRGPSTISLVFAVMTIPFLILSPVVGWVSDKKLGHLRTAMIGMVWLAVVFPLLSVSSHLSVVFIVYFFVGAGLTILSTPLMAMLTITIDPHSRGQHNGKIFSLFNMCYVGGILFGPILSTFITDHVQSSDHSSVTGFFDYTLVFAALYIITLLIFLFFFMILPKIRKSNEPWLNAL
eukprot:gene11527-13452_t